MTNLIWHNSSVTRKRREDQNGHRSAVIWFTGLSGAGKSTIAHAVEEYLHILGCQSFVFDGDNVRHGLCSNLRFSAADRSENIRRVGEVSKLFLEAGLIALVALISPFAQDRSRVRQIMPQGDFLEIYCRCSIEICETRDVKGMYARARRGEIPDFTGISSPYEEPLNPELVLDTGINSVEEEVAKVIQLLRDRNILSAGHEPII